MEMLVEMLGMLVADVARQGRTEQAAGATGNHGRRKYAEQRAARSGHRKTAEHGRQIDARADDGAFGVADGFRPLPAWGTSIAQLRFEPIGGEAIATAGSGVVAPRWWFE